MCCSTTTTRALIMKKRAHEAAAIQSQEQTPPPLYAAVSSLSYLFALSVNCRAPPPPPPYTTLAYHCQLPLSQFGRCHPDVQQEGPPQLLLGSLHGSLWDFLDVGEETRTGSVVTILAATQS